MTLVGPGGPQTVRYAECAALLAWPDGARQLIGEDAISLRIEPALLDPQPDLARDVDRRVLADRRVDMPARPPDDIPQPPPTPSLLTKSITAVRGGVSTLTAWLAVTIFDPERR